MADIAAFERRAAEAEKKIRELTARFDAFTKGGASPQVAELQAENARLKAELAALKGGKGASKAAAPAAGGKTRGWTKTLNEAVGRLVKDAENQKGQSGWPGAHWLQVIQNERAPQWAAQSDARDDIGYLMQQLAKTQKDSDKGVARAAKFLMGRVKVGGGNNKKKDKKQNKKQNKKKGGDKKQADADKKWAKKLKALLKEGGKKGQDMDGMAAFGTCFFCASVQEPEGKHDWLELVMDGYNKDCPPDADERRGGAKPLAKILFSAGDERLAILCHVPKKLQDEHKVTPAQWLKPALDSVGGELVGKPFEKDGGTMQRAEVKADPDNNKFPLKMRDQALHAAYTFLVSNRLTPEEDSGDSIDYGDMAEAAGVEWRDADY